MADDQSVSGFSNFDTMVDAQFRSLLCFRFFLNSYHLSNTACNLPFNGSYVIECMSGEGGFTITEEFF